MYINTLVSVVCIHIPIFYSLVGNWLQLERNLTLGREDYSIGVPFVRCPDRSVAFPMVLLYCRAGGRHTSAN